MNELIKLYGEEELVHDKKLYENLLNKYFKGLINDVDEYGKNKKCSLCRLTYTTLFLCKQTKENINSIENELKELAK
jgi:hypothetical protein